MGRYWLLVQVSLTFFIASAVAQQENETVSVQGYQFASASKGEISSSVMNTVQDGGKFEKVKENLSVLRLSPGDFLDCQFKLPENAFNVKAVVTYYVTKTPVNGRVRWNKTFLSEAEASLTSTSATAGFVYKEIPLKTFERENELRIFSMGDNLDVLNVKILYNYRMPSCKLGDVQVTLTAPDCDKDSLTPDLKLAWSGTGPCEKGWISLQYKDGETWKTIPGAEFDRTDEQWSDPLHGEFIWKNHGLQTMPELKIVYQEGESPKQRDARVAAEKKAQEEKAEQERQTKADVLCKEATDLRQEKKYDEALAKIDEALKMYPDNESYKKEKLAIESENNPFSTEGRRAGDRAVKVINGVEFAFRWCPAGIFIMGSPFTESEREYNEEQHEKNITKGFWIMETEVTQEQWGKIMGDSLNSSSFKGNNLPVENIIWQDAVNFCNNCQSYGLQLCLPTEVQWEYACRAGSTTPFSWGFALNGDEANCDGRYPYGTNIIGKYVATTKPVGCYKCNKWNLYDMHGNVQEWCIDKDNNNSHVLRGGSWRASARNCRSASRVDSALNIKSNDTGFRCVINPE